MKKIADFLNGKKTLIGGFLLLLTTSDYAGQVVTDPSLLELLKEIAQYIIIGGGAHKGWKEYKKIKNK